MEEDLNKGSNRLPTATWQVHELALLDLLLVEYQDFFVEPKSLPPKRSLDHTIPLQPNVEHVNIKSYRYPPKLKFEIENLLKKY